MSTIRDLVTAELNQLREIRHDLHKHPELSYQEQRTSQVIRRELDRLNIKYKAGLGKGTGVLGYIPASTPEGNKRGAVALRADMDALPIIEQTGKAYASGTPGVMHACGHDGHVTMVLGAARVLMKTQRPRPVTLVFQPAEEGGGGAEVMCNEGALAGEGRGGLGNPVECIFGLHGWPTVEVGRVASKPGPLLAATDDFTVTVKGVQSHGAYPHYGHDPILATAHIITALQTIASRNVAPHDSVVCTVGAVNAGTATNIIPEKAEFIGTIRTLRSDTRALAKRRFFEVVENASRACGCEAHIAWHEGYPVTHNDSELTEKFFSVARKTLGGERVDMVQHATMGGEDFSYYGHHVPACFFFLGLRPKASATYPTLHQPDFDFNDDALPAGIEMFCELATT